MNKNRRKIAIFYFLTLLLAFGFLFSPVLSIQADNTDDIEENIEKLQKKLNDAQAAKLQLEKQLTNINYSVSQTQKDIQLTEAIIKQVEDEISRSEKELEAQNQKLKIQRQILSGLLQAAYYNQRESDPLIILAEQNFSAIFKKYDGFSILQEKINELIEQIRGMQSATLKAKEELEVSQEQKEKLLAIKQQQKQELLGDKAETQGDIAEKDATIGELQQKLAELQSDLSKLTGKSYEATDIKDAIKFASSKTGVRKGFLFGMLSVESRLGASVGGCDYKQSKMSSYRLEIFKDIADELDLDYKKLKVSCPPSGYKGTGGAMGAAQFMSDTWWGYKSVIASRTGHNPPNPWNLTDGVMAMASKLKNDGATEDGTVRITSPCNGKKINVKWEIYASMKYLGWSCYALTNYGPRIQSLAGGYDKL